MQFQSIYDSVTRCLGQSAETGAAMFGMDEEQNSSGQQQQQQKQAARGPMHADSDNNADDVIVHWENGSRKPGEEVLDEARSVAKAKQVANPSRYQQQQRSSKRKRKNKRETKEDIFRDKKSGASDRKQQTFAQMLIPSIALCFATPIRGTEEEQDEISTVRSGGEEESETGTLNTYEDTVTSTVLFESKYSHIQESRPPMPLFNQFKLGGKQDEIRTIVATDSHSSMKMMKLMQEQNNAKQENVQFQEEEFEDDSSSESGHDEEDGKPRASSSSAAMMDDVPDMKEMSSSSRSSSSKSKIHMQREPYGRRI
jgi:hypothetical protein